MNTIQRIILSFSLSLLLLVCFFIFATPARAATLYQEDFSNGQAAGWQEQADPGAVWQVKDGKYYLNISTYRTQADSIYQSGFSWQDYSY